MPKQYNALTGAELRTVILNEVARALDNTDVCGQGVTYPRVSWQWQLDLRLPDADRPDRSARAGDPELEITDPEVNVVVLTGDSRKRFKNHPPSPTEVRQAEGLPLPEA